MTQATLLQLRTVEMFVPGTPVPQGSMVAFYHKAMGRASLKATNEAELERWRKTVSGYARLMWPGPPTTNPVRLELCFWFDRNRVVGNGQRQTLKGARPSGRTTGDVDKLTRAVMDALAPKKKPIVYVDDARVVSVYAEKRFASGKEVAGVLIKIEELSE